jgi:hypothetical protein
MKTERLLTLAPHTTTRRRMIFLNYWRKRTNIEHQNPRIDGSQHPEGYGDRSGSRKCGRVLLNYPRDDASVHNNPKEHSANGSKCSDMATPTLVSAVLASVFQSQRLGVDSRSNTNDGRKEVSLPTTHNQMPSSTPPPLSQSNLNTDTHADPLLYILDLTKLHLWIPSNRTPKRLTSTDILPMVRRTRASSNGLFFPLAARFEARDVW